MVYKSYSLLKICILKKESKELKTQLKVAGLIPVTLIGGSLKKVKGYTKTLNELVCYLYCFLENTTYPSNTSQATETIGKMLENAVLRGEILSFTFPTKIREKLYLRNRYHLNLKSDSAHTFYVTSLLPQQRLAYDIDIMASGQEKRQALIEIQHLVLNSDKHIKSVCISKHDGKFITIIKLKLTTKRRLRLVADSLTESIQKIQKILL